MKKLKIIFTGGGTAGHVTPNIALIEYFQDLGWDIVYVGSRSGIEREIIANSGVRYLGIASGLSLIHISEPTRLLSIAYALLCV